MTLSESTNLYTSYNNPFAKKEEQKVNDSATEKQTAAEITLYGENATSASKVTTQNNSNIGLVSQDALKADENMGLGIQRTTTTQTVTNPQTTQTTAQVSNATSTSATTETTETKFLDKLENDPVWAKNAENNKKNDKKSMFTMLKGYYTNIDLDKLSDEEIAEKVATILNKWMEDGTISDVKQAELYLDRAESLREHNIVILAISKLKNTNSQAEAVEMACNKGSDAQKAATITNVNKNMDNFDSSIQPAVMNSVKGGIDNMKDPEMIKGVTDDLFNTAENNVANGNTSEAAKRQNELAVHAGLNISENESFDNVTRTKYGQNAVSFIPSLNKDAQLEYSNRAFLSEFKDVRLAMANEGQNLHVDNQSEFVKMAMGLKDEDIDNILAKNAYNYDESVRADVINTISQSQYDSTKETLNNARVEYERQQQSTYEKSESSSKTSSKEETKTNSSKVESQKEIEKIISNNRLNISQKAIKIKGITNKEQQKLAISKIVETSTLPEVKNLVLSGLKSEVFDYLLSNVSSKNMTTLDSIKQFMQPQHVKRYNEILETRNNNSFVNNATNVMTAQRRNLFIS